MTSIQNTLQKIKTNLSTQKNKLITTDFQNNLVDQVLLMQIALEASCVAKRASHYGILVHKALLEEESK